MNEGIKNKRIDIRVSTEELEKIKQKAHGYQSVSAYMIDAALNFDDRLGRQRLAAIDEWAALYVQYKKDINGIGNNLNQLAHYANQMNRLGLADTKVLEENHKMMESWIEIAKVLVRGNENLRKAIVSGG